MAPYIGQRMRRVEDERLITGKGRYAGDVRLDDLVHVVFCRSVLPHARIRAVDASIARSMPGVIAVWTADDVPEVAAGLSDWGPAPSRPRHTAVVLRSGPRPRTFSASARRSPARSVSKRTTCAWSLRMSAEASGPRGVPLPRRC